MDKSFADIRTDAFSASFPDGDFDFKNLSLDVKFEAEFSNENIPTEEDETQHQEAVLFSTETKDVPTAENIAKEPLNEDDFQQEEAKNLEKTPENDCKGWDGNSEQDISLSGEDEEDDEEDMVKGEEPRQLFTVCCNSRSCNHNKPDRFLTEGQTLDPISSKDLQVRNKEQRDNETDENVTYFGRLPDCGSEMVIKADENDEEKHECKGEKQEGLSDRQQEDTEMKQEESISDGYFREEIYNSCIDGPVKASLEIPEKPLQNQMDLMSENEEKYLEKMKDFSGEEHQEAGESFADYPSDLSSCEYIENEEINQDCNYQLNAQEAACLENSLINVVGMGKAEDSDGGGDECLSSICLDADKFRFLDVLTGEDDLENMCPQDVNNTLLQDVHSESSAEFANLNTSDSYSERDPNINWNLDLITSDNLLSEDFLGTEHTDRQETVLSDVTQCPPEKVSASLVVERFDARSSNPSNLGSLDDSFFYGTEFEASGISELGQLEDEDFEDESYWKQEQERITAFHRIYYESGRGDRKERRQIKVPFCADPLSQVIYYDSDSDRDSFSSSTSGEEDVSSAETSEVLTLAQKLKWHGESKESKTCCELPKIQLPENKEKQDLINKQNCRSKQNCLNMLKVTLKMVLVAVMGLMIFWLVTVESRWLSQILFF
ncbi:uncharacterized protein si:dkey-183p4.10 isoform X2 [Antennarius striatus]|uniref:uncharacterized protein si:dkey-183p4.10 isoform X2 n=1 Tax=Antennarius striatus TaxID=241820 RepID=UPI0035B36E89